MWAARHLVIKQTHNNCVRQHAKRRLTASPPPPSSSPSAATAEAPRKKHWLLYRMAPPKGGTEPPDAKFVAIAAVVFGAGYYAWFVDPPKEQKWNGREWEPRQEPRPTQDETATDR